MKRAFVFSGYVPAAVFVLVGCMHRPVDQTARRWDHMRWDHMMGHGGWGMVLLWLVVIIALALVVYALVVRGKDIRVPGSPQAGETPVEILQKRYARGEITKEEFDRIRDDIESS